MLKSRIGAGLYMARSLQRQLRMKRIRNAYLKLKEATIKIQKWYRCTRLRNKFRLVCKGIMTFQAIVRGKQGRRDVSLIKELIHKKKLDSTLIALQAKEKLWLAAIQKLLVEEREIELEAMEKERRKWRENSKIINQANHSLSSTLYAKGKKQLIIENSKAQTLESLTPIMIKVDKDISQDFPLGLCAGLHQSYLASARTLKEGKLEKNSISNRPKSSQQFENRRKEEFKRNALKQLVVGDHFFASLDRSGYVYTFGDGKKGALGHGGIIVTKLAAGASHLLMLTEVGALYGCGANGNGQLGIPTPTNFGKSTYALSNNKAVVNIPTPGTLIDIAAGDDHSVAILASGGHVLEWGLYSKRIKTLEDILQENDATIDEVINNQNNCTVASKYKQHQKMLRQPIPLETYTLEEQDRFDQPWKMRRVFLPEPAAKVYCGKSYSAVHTRANALYTWGRNPNGELGRDPICDEEFRPAPVMLKFSSKSWCNEVDCIEEKVLRVSQVAAGRNHILALTLSDSASKSKNMNMIYGWGSNSGGQLGKVIPTTAGKSSQPLLLKESMSLKREQESLTFTSITAGGDISVIGYSYSCSPSSASSEKREIENEGEETILLNKESHVSNNHDNNNKKDDRNTYKDGYLDIAVEKETEKRVERTRNNTNNVSNSIERNTHVVEKFLQLGTQGALYGVTHEEYISKEDQESILSLNSTIPISPTSIIEIEEGQEEYGYGQNPKLIQKEKQSPSKFSLYTAQQDYFEQKKVTVTSQILDMNELHHESAFQQKIENRIQKHYTPICIYSNTLSIVYIHDMIVLSTDNPHTIIRPNLQGISTGITPDILKALGTETAIATAPSTSIFTSKAFVHQHQNHHQTNIAFKLASELAKKKELRDKLEARLQTELQSVAKVHKSESIEIRNYEKKKAKEEEKMKQNEANNRHTSYMEKMKNLDDVKVKQLYLKKLGLTTKKALGLDRKKDHLALKLEKSIGEMKVVLDKVKEIKEKTHSKNYSIDVEKLLLGSWKGSQSLTSEELTVNSPIAKEMNQLIISSVVKQRSNLQRNKKNPSSSSKHQHRHCFTPKSEQHQDHFSLHRDRRHFTSPIYPTSFSPPSSPASPTSPAFTYLNTNTPRTTTSSTTTPRPKVSKNQDKGAGKPHYLIHDVHSEVSHFGHQIKETMLQELKESVRLATDALHSPKADTFAAGYSQSSASVSPSSSSFFPSPNARSPSPFLSPPSSTSRIHSETKITDDYNKIGNSNSNKHKTEKEEEVSDLMDVRNFLQEIQDLQDLTEKYHTKEELAIVAKGVTSSKKKEHVSCAASGGGLLLGQGGDYIHCRSHNPVNTKRKTVTSIASEKKRQQQLQLQLLEQDLHPAFVNVVRVENKSQPINGYGKNQNLNRSSRHSSSSSSSSSQSPATRSTATTDTISNSNNINERKTRASTNTPIKNKNSKQQQPKPVLNISTFLNRSHI